jgi:hypothetical protein
MYLPTLLQLIWIYSRNIVFRQDMQLTKVLKLLFFAWVIYNFLQKDFFSEGITIFFQNLNSSFDNLPPVLCKVKSGF